MQRACELLTIHAIVEEELLYPAARDALEADDKDDVDEAYVEHFLVKTLIEKFTQLKAGDEGFDATFKVMSENVNHHVEEEETSSFRSCARRRSTWWRSARRSRAQGRAAEQDHRSRDRALSA